MTSAGPAQDRLTEEHAGLGGDVHLKYVVETAEVF